MTEATVVLAADQLSQLPWFYEHAIIDAREDREDGSVSLDVRLSESEAIEMDRRLGLGNSAQKLPWED
jgi:GTP-binding protein HflX